MNGRHFEISIISNNTTTKELDGAYLEEWLNQNFPLFKYGTGLEEVFLLFSVTKKKEQQEGSFRHHPEEHFLELTLPLPEARLHGAKKKEATLLMASELLSLLNRIPERAIAGFQLPAFREELAEMIR